MPVREYRPSTPGMRGASVSDFSELTAKTPYKKLTEGKRKTGGRSNVGRLTTRHIGGGVKQRYRFIDFKRNKDNVPGIVETIEYDPNRTAFIALIKYRDGERRYILQPHGLKVGEEVLSGEKVEPRVGSCLPIKNIPAGMKVHNIELTPGKGGQIVRSAGTFAEIKAKEGNYAIVLLPSGEERRGRGGR